VGHAPRERKRRLRAQMVDFAADPEGDLSLEEHDVLVLAVVDV
jgi:hypothetical protein